MKWLVQIEKTALIRGDQKISYAELRKSILRTAKMLREGCKAGDKIVVIGANTPEWVTALYSIWQIGATVVPIDYMSTPEEIAYILDDSGAAYVFCDADAEQKILQAEKFLQKTVLPPRRRLELLQENWKAEGEVPNETVGESPDDALALIIYTSGTTGNPKGVMLTFRNLRSNTEACTTQIQVFIPEDRVLVALPLHHAYPLMASVVMPMSIGATAVFTLSLTGKDIKSALQDNQCTFIVGVPRLVEILRNSILSQIQASRIAKFFLWLCGRCNSLWLSRKIFRKVQDAFGGHIRYISSGGAANDPQVTRDFYALGFQLLEGYGMTETAPMISFTPPGRYKPGSPGKPIPCNEVKIENGEVLVRGDNVMKGYYNLPEETARVLTPDGWLHTGDLGYVDEDGFLFLTGRSKELIILGNGKNISPDELERKLMAHAGGLLAECAVTDDGHSLIAVAVPDEKTLADRAILNIRQTVMDVVIEPYNEEVPSYKRVAKLILQEEPLPRTRLGKLRRHIIRQNLEKVATQNSAPAEQKAAPLPDTPITRKVMQCLEEAAERKVLPDEHFELDIGLDSLGKMALFTNLCKTLDKNLQLDMLAQYPTARKLSEAIAAMEEGGPAPAKEATVPEEPLRDPAWTHGIYRAFVKLFLHTISKIEVNGLENIPAGSCIFAPNHQSSLDAFYFVSAVDSRRFKTIYYYIISKYIESGFRRWFASRHNLVAMEINGDLRSSLGKLSQALHQGGSVLIFPEGTRSMDGTLGEFRPAFAQLAVQAEIPVVPVVIKGTFDVLPRDRSFPRFGKRVSITFLPPCVPGKFPTIDAICQETRGKIAADLEKQ